MGAQPATRGPRRRKISPSQLRPLEPAASKTQEEKPDENQQGGLDARVFGTHVHALLEKLPGLQGTRAKRLRKPIWRAFRGRFRSRLRSNLRGRARRAGTPRYGAGFCRPARAEIALVGQLALHDGQKLALSGRVDRYIETKTKLC